MALIHPTVRNSEPLTKRKFHPAVCLLSGFAFIIASGVLVHLLFRLFV
jgi:hypothetical protein